MLRHKISRFATLLLLGAAFIPAPVFNASAQPAQLASGFVIKDLRDNGPKAVRFAAVQGTELAPNIALLGGDREVFQKIRGAVEEAQAAGFPVRAILIGPVSASPALEIYAKGQKVTVDDLSPYDLSHAGLVKLIGDIHREYYAR